MFGRKYLRRILANQETIMSQQTDLAAAVARVQAGIDRAVALIQSEPAAVDLQPSIDALNGAAGKLEAVLPPAPPPPPAA